MYLIKHQQVHLSINYVSFKVILIEGELLHIEPFNPFKP